MNRDTRPPCFVFKPAAFAAAAFLLLHILPAAGYAAVTLPEEHVSGSVIYDAEDDKYLSPGMVTVIRPEEKSGEQRSLPDLLEDVPGLRVIRLQGRNGYAVASVRGSTSSQVAVYVDGVLVNLQSEAAVDLSAIPVDNVEKIEVYRGYVPARLGAQAMGGVINIITKQPVKPETNISLGVGSFGRYKGNLSYSAALGGGKFFGAFGYEKYAGDFEYWNDNGTAFNFTDDYTAKRNGNDFENMDVLLKWQDEHWRAKASWSRKNRSLPLIGPTLDKPGETPRPWPLQDTDRWDLSVARSQVTGPVSWSLGFMHTAQDKKYDSRRGGAQSSIGFGDVTENEYKAARTGVSLSASMAVGERHFLELLAEYSEESLNVDGDSVFLHLNGISDYSRNDTDVSLQDTVALDRAGTFLATPSLRWHSIDGENHLTWQVALTKEFSERWMLKGAYGTYARAPNMYERYGDGAFILPSRSSLMWETGTQFDLGVIWSDAIKQLGGANANVALSAFWRDTDDLIEFYMEGPRYARYDNIAKSQVKGAEVSAAFDWERWQFTLSGTWMEGVNKSPGEGSYRYYGMTLPNRPEWSGAARVTRKFARGSVFAEYQYTGENYVDTRETILFNARNVFNIGVKYDLSHTAQLAAGIDDVFNDADGWRMLPDSGLNGATRVLWYPVEGRSYYMTLNIKL